MDEMKIVSKFTTNVISKLVKMVLQKKLGYDVDIQLNEIKNHYYGRKNTRSFGRRRRTRQRGTLKDSKEYWFELRDEPVLRHGLFSFSAQKLQALLWRDSKFKWLNTSHS